ncbi:GGDEF domain-containing protein [Pontibacterium sp.]|uniref:GGDEF domain-containing protein n=1 Tax=Pontibacterium sp. TaxID=2036026 RepID=UPI003518DCA4
MITTIPLHKKLKQVMHRALLVCASVTVILFLLHNLFYAQKALEKEGEYLTGIVFDRLYSSMMTGWDKHSIDQIFTDLNARAQDMTLELHRSEMLENQFGRRTTDTPTPEQSAFLTSQQGKSLIEYHWETGVTYTKRIHLREECLACHTQGTAGATAGILSVTYPFSSVRVSLSGSMMATFLSLIFAITFCYWLFKRFMASQIEEPVERLVHQINRISSHDDLDKTVNIQSEIREIQQIETAFNQKNGRLKEAYREVAHLSVTDTLTGLYNRNKLAETLAEEICRFQRHGQGFALAMMDLDGFKQINDVYGHDAGDIALVEFANLIRKNLRPTDTAIRLGGDEFLVLLGHTNREQAQHYVDRIQTQVNGHAVKYGDIEFTLATSVGLACCNEDGQDGEILLQGADQAMYQNKQNRKKARKNHPHTVTEEAV